MISCVWAMLCLRSIVSQSTNNVSLIEVLDDITIQPPPDSEEQPFQPINFDFVMYWKIQNDNQEDDYRFRFRIVAPSGKVLLESEQVVDFTKFPKPIMVYSFSGLPIAGSGSYEFQIQIPNNSETEWKIDRVVSLGVNYEKLENDLINDIGAESLD